MEFRIADTFTTSLAKLTGDEQKAAKTTAFDLQINPDTPGHSFHKLDKAKDKNFWSVRVGRDIRIIVHKTKKSLLLCYVDHHDKAYDWAERRKIETHPTTGAAQLVEIRETVQEINLPVYVEASNTLPAKPALLARISDDELLSYGVPAEWLADVRNATEDSLLGLADHLPAEAAEAVLELATGGRPRVPEPVLATVDPFQHPDAQRRFRVVADLEELKQALEYPWERWTIFLHPAQRELVERRFDGPVRVSGSAGTGKTVVALHRAAHLARTNPDSRVLLTTFSDTLANALRYKLRLLMGAEPRVWERIDVEAIDTAAVRLSEAMLGQSQLAPPATVRELIAESVVAAGEGRLSASFLAEEWSEVVDAWQLQSWEAYRDIARLGRKTRLPESRRKVLWGVFERVRADLETRGMTTRAKLYHRLAAHLMSGKRSPYDFVVVDEAQDLSVPQLRLLGSLGGGRPDGLFFAGDLGQRIFQLPFSWLALGVDIRGRSSTLKVNYRTSHQIRSQADRLLRSNLADADGNSENREGTVSVFNGPAPSVTICSDVNTECAAVSEWLKSRIADGLASGEIGVFVRSAAELPRASAAVSGAGLTGSVLDDRVQLIRDQVAIGTMHLSKGLEFRAVAVMACDDEVLPLQSRIELLTDEGDLEDLYETERHLLYVACTRARDHLLVTATAPASEFLDDLGGSNARP
jgi:mRNA-degrading endonuclease RelE of RelBE toxin-antitoxin system